MTETAKAPAAKPEPKSNKLADEVKALYAKLTHEQRMELKKKTWMANADLGNILKHDDEWLTEWLTEAKKLVGT